MGKNYWVAVVFMIAGNLAAAIEPADKDLIPEARAVLKYLESIYGKQVLAGANGTKGIESIRRVCGKEPAIVTFDLSGWNSPPWGKSYTSVVDKTIESAKSWWEHGGIVTMQLHWIHPANPDGSAWLGVHGRKSASPPFEFAAAMKPGTKAHEELMRDLKGHADYLKRLADARVPVLWRPFHEIEGGWFWWTDEKQPENTAALWRFMFNYFVKERKLHNLIWVYSAALRCGKGKDSTGNVEMRRRFYPGPEFVDIAGIDIYPNSYFGYGKPQDDTYAKAFEVMKQVAPGKMLALCECEAIPDPDRMAKEGPRWLYCLPWWEEGKRHPAEWIRKTYTHELMITREALPNFRRPK
ncbi:MAG: glycoside hydrolase family 26 protein [Candidatus Sumerlaeia bacterium]|nr:glycoside hydrolase family 26 protein [Candidatus Sumerlaeia bacterium]